MAVYLLKVLEMTPFFYNGGSDPRNVKLQDKVGMGAVILKHLQNLPCNAHEISEMELTGGSNARDSTVHEIGAASYGILKLQKSSKLYKKSFENVLQGNFQDALPILLEHLRFLDQFIARPFREYNDCQEAIKQCYSATANCYRTKASGNSGNKKEKDAIV
ncbi:hypothetical protein TCAL_12027 [Tigriopus californicus]|uniref:Uncharacterized protein n=1 Tax=Tigriopus californicus TaxID=6832 RepID=A0A553PF76_TIGCA|nr:hypothetical protein TCAL_12027 [Tigriopus californicus]